MARMAAKLAKRESAEVWKLAEAVRVRAKSTERQQAYRKMLSLRIDPQELYAQQRFVQSDSIELRERVTRPKWREQTQHAISRCIRVRSCAHTVRTRRHKRQTRRAVRR